jgi:hypothetical protein
MRITVKITSEDIERAHQREDSRCPIAMAIIRSYPDARHVKVTSEKIVFSDTTTRLRYTFTTPAKAAEFVNRWDETGEAAPLTFRLDQTHKIKTVEMKTRTAQTVSATKRPTPGSARTVPTRPRYLRGPAA